MYVKPIIFYKHNDCDFDTIQLQYITIFGTKQTHIYLSRLRILNLKKTSKPYIPKPRLHLAFTSNKRNINSYEWKGKKRMINYKFHIYVS